MIRWLFSRHYEAGRFWRTIATYAVNDVRFGVASEAQRTLHDRVMREVMGWTCKRGG